MKFRISGTEFSILSKWNLDSASQLSAGFRIPKPRIPDFTVKISQIPEYSFTIITINLEILERSLLGSYFLKLYLDWKHGKIKFLRFLNKFVKTSLSSPGLLRPAESVKMESIKKLNNFNFQRAPIRTFSSELFHTTYYIYSPWKVWKRMQYAWNYSGKRFLSTEN